MPIAVDEALDMGDEWALRELLRQSGHLEREVRRWSEYVLTLLPPRLPLLVAEKELLKLYLAQQRRLNLELNQQTNSRPGLIRRLAKALPFMQTPDPAILRLAHHLVAGNLEEDIERVVLFYSKENSLNEQSDQIIDWRVSVRYLAQRLYQLLASISQTPRRESDYAVIRFAVTARELAAEIAGKREQLSQAGMLSG